MDELIDKIIQTFSSEELELLIDKRLTTAKLSLYLYLRMLLAAEATNKSLSNCIATALETYTIRQRSEHLNSLKLQAAAKNLSLDDFVIEVIKKEFN